MTDIKDVNGKEIKFNNVSKEDYPELEGKLIDFEFRTGEVETGVVVGCNRAVGCTIVRASDKESFLVCVPGPITRKYKSKYDVFYEDLFDALVEGISNGRLYAPDLKAIIGEGEGSCTGSQCAYRA